MSSPSSWAATSLFRAHKVMTTSRGYLDAYLGPLAEWLDDPAVSEIAINPDGQVWIEREGMEYLERVSPPCPVEADRLARQIAGAAGLKVSEDHPIISARTDWNGAELRAQAVLPPAIETGAALSFRKYRPDHRTIGDFPFLYGRSVPMGERLGRQRAAMTAAIDAGDAEAALRQAVRDRLNVLISGGTSSAKTTLARTMIACMGEKERLITIEDARELHPRQQNRVELVADRDPTSPRTTTHLLQSALRMRPDRIVVGELRGTEAWTYLEAINTGHGGSITTIHAEHPDMAVERLAMMVTGARLAMPYADITRYVRRSIDLIVQLERAGGRRGIVEMTMPAIDSQPGGQDGA